MHRAVWLITSARAWSLHAEWLSVFGICGHAIGWLRTGNVTRACVGFNDVFGNPVGRLNGNICRFAIDRLHADIRCGVRCDITRDITRWG